MVEFYLTEPIVLIHFFGVAVQLLALLLHCSFPLAQVFSISISLFQLFFKIADDLLFGLDFLFKQPVLFLKLYLLNEANLHALFLFVFQHCDFLLQLAIFINDLFELLLHLPLALLLLIQQDLFFPEDLLMVDRGFLVMAPFLRERFNEVLISERRQFLLILAQL